MGFITAAIVGGLVLGAASVKNARDERRAVEKRTKQQEKRARNLARESDPLADTGAEIEIGTEGMTRSEQAGTTQSSKTKKKQTASTAINRGSAGGVGGLLRSSARDLF